MQAEGAAALPDGGGERFAGYVVLGATFESGHVLALRRFAASSIGPAYTSVWHRSQAGDWTFYQDVEPCQACARYFGRMIRRNIVRPIRCEWTGPLQFEVGVDGPDELRWQVRLQATVASRMLNGVAAVMPKGLWHRPSAVNAVGRAAAAILGAGRLCLAGKTPNGQAFLANPRRIWVIVDSRATVAGEDCGAARPAARAGALGDFWIPQRGLFAITSAYLEAASQSCPLPCRRRRPGRCTRSEQPCLNCRTPVKHCHGRPVRMVRENTGFGCLPSEGPSVGAAAARLRGEITFPGIPFSA